MKSGIKDPRRVHDHWTRKAKRENYPARSVYKLMDVDRRYGLLKPGAKVLDLGCAPGSWTKYAAEKVGTSGFVVGVDLKKPEQGFSSYANFVLGDVTALPVDTLLPRGRYDVVLSDMAPDTSGVKMVDQAKSLALVKVAIRIVRVGLKPGGAFYFKVFQGPDTDEVFKGLTKEFETVRRIKPESSRSCSVEIFGLALGYKPSVTVITDETAG